MSWCKGSSIPNRILRTLHAPAPPPAQNHARVVDSEQASQDAPRASATSRPKPQEGRRFRTEFSGLSTHQPRHPPKTVRRSSIPNRLLAPRASAAPFQNHEKGVHSEQNSQLHAPAPPPAQNHEKVVDSEQNSQDCPRTSPATRPKP